jgi:hypothetical protein
MFLLMLHLVAITLLVLAVAGVAFRLGVQTGERRLQQRLEWAAEDQAAQDSSRQNKD